MDFITKLFFSKYKNDVYDACFMIINKYPKMILYIFIIKNIDAIELKEIIFKKNNIKIQRLSENGFEQKIAVY